MALKTGLRTRAKTPLVISSVRSSGSTPTRHDTPIETWAATGDRDAEHAEHEPDRCGRGGFEWSHAVDADQGRDRCCDQE